MEIIDAQLHVWDFDRPDSPWDPKFGSRGGTYAAIAAHFREALPVTPALGVKAMNEAGVDAAMIVSPTLYGFDPSFSLKAAAAHSGKFGVVGVLDPAADDIEEKISNWRSTPHALGVRIVVMTDNDRDRLRDGYYHRMLAAAEQHEVPLCIFPPRYLSELASTARSYPRLQLIIDHLGLPQPPLIRPDNDPFERLPELLDLARFPNVAVKLTAAPTLSKMPFPYSDIWPSLHGIFQAFGLARVMWGTDWTRVASILSYEQGVRYMRESREISDSDKVQLMGQSLRSIFRWPRTQTKK